MKVAFRVDASMQIGTGHVMRCLTLADKLSEDAGTRISFFCRHIPSGLGQIIKQKGYDLFILPESTTADGKLAHSSWLGVTQEADAAATLEILQKAECDWLIVDHYALDILWERILRPAVKKILVIDDLADREHDCDILLDQNLYSDQETRYADRLASQSVTLLGPRYALLRKEFAQCRDLAKHRTNSVTRIFVFFGGVDINDLTSRTITALSQITGHKFLVDVVVGSQHPNIKGLEILCQQFGYNFYVQTDKMAMLMVNADFAIGAGGGAVWERACVMLPTLSIPIAQHQIKQLGDIALTGITYTFDASDYTVDKIKIHAEALLENKALRTLLSIRSAETVDGNGAYRVKQFLRSELEIQLRQADVSDEKSLFEWRNHPNIRAVSFNKSEILWQQHCDWFKALLLDENKVLLIGEYKNEPIGVVRFDLQTDSSEISIYLVQRDNNNGFGMPLIKSAEKWLSKYRPAIKILKAQVLEENILSQSFFVKAGYALQTKIYYKEL